MTLKMPPPADYVPPRSHVSRLRYEIFLIASAVLAVLFVTAVAALIGLIVMLGRALPVEISTRPGFIVNSVLQIHNASSTPLTGVSVRVINRDGSQSVRMALGTLAPGQTIEPDWNWSVASGDLITVSAEGYNDKSATAP